MMRISDASLVLLPLALVFAISTSAQTPPSRELSLAPEKSKTTKSVDSAATAPAPGNDVNRVAGNGPSEKNNSDKRDPDKRADKVARDNAQKHYKAGVKYGKANLHRQAAQYFEQAIAADPNFIDAYYALGETNLNLGRYREAIAAFEQVIKLDPQAADAYTLLGQAYVKLNEEKQKSLSSNSPVTQLPAIVTGPSPVATVPTTRDPDPTQFYKVGAGDVLDIRIPGSLSNESTLFTVASSGMVDHPLVGHSIKVGGRTTEEIAALIGDELKRRAITGRANPEVGVRDYNSHTILVSGLVKEPGTKILRREAIPLYVVLADAQPLPEAALVTVMQQQTAQSTTLELADAQQTSRLVRPGDVITIQAAPKEFFYVGGDVKSPGEHAFRRGITLTQAILAAGGVTPLGAKAQVMRGNADGLLTQQEYKLKDINRGKVPDPVIEPGDRITVSH